LIIAGAALAGMPLAFAAQAAAGEPMAKAAQNQQCRIAAHWGTPIFGRVCR
jgi:hypothetical protein